MTRTFPHVLRRFPDHVELVTRLADKDHEFRALCEDYTLVCQALVEIRAHTRLPKEMQENALREYGIFLAELELDISDALAREA